MTSRVLTPVELVVGLGNPGSGHADDRHNAGFWFVDRVVEQMRLSWRQESRYKGELARAESGIRFLKPQTYMNLSGESVAACASYFRIAVDAILVVHDELDLDAGVVRLKRGGGHGGHNGLRNIDQHLSSPGYLRARIGIGHPGSAREVSDYVLGKPRQDERVAIDEALDSLLAVFDTVCAGHLDRAMNSLNRRHKKAKENDSNGL